MADTSKTVNDFNTQTELQIKLSDNGDNTYSEGVDLRRRVVAAAADLNVPAANTAAVITYAAVAAAKHVLAGVIVSYSAAPTGGRLTITDNAVTIFDIDITGAGPQVITFPEPIKGAAVNTAMVLTLAAAGAAVVGKLRGFHWTEI